MSTNFSKKKKKKKKKRLSLNEKELNLRSSQFIFLELLKKVSRTQKLPITIMSNKEKLNINDSFRAYNNVTKTY